MPTDSLGFLDAVEGLPEQLAAAHEAAGDIVVEVFVCPQSQHNELEGYRRRAMRRSRTPDGLNRCSFCSRTCAACCWRCVMYAWISAW